jgi:hypothetical protein
MAGRRAGLGDIEKRVLAHTRVRAVLAKRLYVSHHGKEELISVVV